MPSPSFSALPTGLQSITCKGRADIRNHLLIPEAAHADDAALAYCPLDHRLQGRAAKQGSVYEFLGTHYLYLSPFWFF
jgi:hypothetical protein